MDKILRSPKENVIIGFRQVKKAATNGHIEYIVIAEDTEKTLITQIVAICEKKNIPYKFSLRKTEMGENLQIDVKCSMCALKNSKN